MEGKELWVIPIIAGIVCLVEYIVLLFTQSFHWLIVVGIILDVILTIVSCVEILDRRDKNDK